MEGFFTYIFHRDPQNIVGAVVGEKLEYRVCSFCKSYKKFLLWSYYANSHKGVCLEYSVRKHQLRPGCVLEPVQYNRTLPSLNTKASVNEQAKKFLLTKMMDWKTEQEVRLLAPKSIRASIPFGRLTGIIFGLNHPDAEVRQKVVSTVRGLGRSGPMLYQATIEGDSAEIIRRNLIDIS